MVREGDLARLGLLYERYKKILFTFFYRMNFNEQLSKDLVQNVFIRIINYRKTFRGEGEFKVWMFHIARNVNHEYFRKNKRHHINDSLEGKHERLTGYPDDILQESLDHDLGLLQKAITRLDAEKQEIIMLSKIECMKYRDIGELIGCTENTVKIKVFRALKDLKSEFEKIKHSHG